MLYAKHMPVHFQRKICSRQNVMLWYGMIINNQSVTRLVSCDLNLNSVYSKMAKEQHHFVIRIVLGDRRWTADGYVIISVYLHKTPVTPSPWTLIVT